jgi:hypothetical protein
MDISIQISGQLVSSPIMATLSVANRRRTRQWLSSLLPTDIARIILSYSCSHDCLDGLFNPPFSTIWEYLSCSFINSLKESIRSRYPDWQKEWLIRGLSNAETRQSLKTVVMRLESYYGLYRSCHKLKRAFEMEWGSNGKDFLDYVDMDLFSNEARHLVDAPQPLPEHAQWQWGTMGDNFTCRAHFRAEMDALRPLAALMPLAEQHEVIKRTRQRFLMYWSAIHGYSNQAGWREYHASLNATQDRIEFEILFAKLSVVQQILRQKLKHGVDKFIVDAIIKFIV